MLNCNGLLKLQKLPRLVQCILPMNYKRWLTDLALQLRLEVLVSLAFIVIVGYVILTGERRMGYECISLCSDILDCRADGERQNVRFTIPIKTPAEISLYSQHATNRKSKTWFAGLLIDAEEDAMQRTWWPRSALGRSQR